MLLEMSLGLRLVLLLALVGITFWGTMRGLENGILLLLATAMTSAWFIRSEGGLPNLTLDRVIWPLVLLVFLIRWKQHKIERTPLDFPEYLMITLSTVIVFSMSLHESFSSDAYGGEKLRMGSFLRGFAIPFAAYFIMRRGVLAEAQVRSFLTGVGLITLYLGFTGVAEAWHLNWLVYPKYILDPTEGIHFGKVRGPFVSASADGLAMAMGLPIFIWLLFNRRDTSRWLWIFGIVSVAIATPYVYQRSAWLGVALALGVTALTWPKHRGILMASMMLVLPCAVMFVLTSDKLEQEVQTKLNTSKTIDYRLNMIDLSLAQIREHPVTGVGFNRFVEQLAEDENYKSAASHNTPLTLFVELGLLGFVPYLTMYGALLFESLKSYIQHTWSRSMIALLWSVTAPFLATTNLTDTRILMYQNILLFGLWGIVLGIVRRKAGSVGVAEVARRRATRAMALSSQPGGTGIPEAWEHFK